MYVCMYPFTSYCYTANTNIYPYLPTPPLGQDMTKGQF